MGRKHRMVLLAFVGFALVSILLASCKITDTAYANNGPAVHMGPTNFVQSTITIKKGETLLLVDDVNLLHIIKNGTWQGTQQKPGTESGAPTVNKSFNGNDRSPIRPFTTAGTFQLYCTIHEGMTLAVTVQ